MVKAREPPIVPVTEPQFAALLGQVFVFVTSEDCGFSASPHWPS